MGALWSSASLALTLARLVEYLDPAVARQRCNCPVPSAAASLSGADRVGWASALGRGLVDAGTYLVATFATLATVAAVVLGLVAFRAEIVAAVKTVWLLAIERRQQQALSRPSAVHFLVDPPPNAEGASVVSPSTTQLTDSTAEEAVARVLTNRDTTPASSSLIVPAAFEAVAAATKHSHQIEEEMCRRAEEAIELRIALDAERAKLAQQAAMSAAKLAETEAVMAELSSELEHQLLKRTEAEALAQLAVTQLSEVQRHTAELSAKLEATMAYAVALEQRVAVKLPGGFVAD